MNLNVNEWKEFTVSSLFRLETTKGKDSTELISGEDIPYIAAKHDENGLSMMCKSEGFEDWISDGNCIVFIQLGAGSAGYVNYIEKDFIGMNGKTCCGYIDGKMNPKVGIFLETVLCKERPKYSFGRSWTGDRLKDTIIKLPIEYETEEINGDIVYKVDSEGNKIPKIDETYKYSDKGYIPDFKFMEHYIESLNSESITTSRGGVQITYTWM